jgi:hypothetical protein
MAIRMLLADQVLTSTLTSSDFAAALPVTNLQTEGRGKVARTSNATGTKTINGNLLAAASINCAVLYRHNLRYNGTWRLQLYSAANQTTQVYDSAATNAYTSGLFTGWDAGFSVMYFTTVASVLSFRVELADGSHPSGYLEAKRLLLGSYFEPGVNVEYPLALRWKDDSVQRRTMGSSVRTDARAKYRCLTGGMGRITDAERDTLTDQLRDVGLSKEIFVSAFPGATGTKERDYALLGKFPTMPQMRHHEYNNHRVDFEVEEV